MKEEKQKAVIYARFSSDKQREESIDGQIRECTAYAESQDLEIVGTYIDRALSARTDNRPDFLRMIADSSRKLFQYVIVYQLDRFSRSRYDSAIYKNKLKKNGVRVLSAKERIGNDPASIILESMLEGYAEYYSAELSQKVMRGMTENVLEGKWPGGRTPLGYHLTADKKLEINPEEAEIVKLVYKLYLENYRAIDIADYLNMHNYRTRKGQLFKRNSFHSVLDNSIYTGTYTWHGNTVENFAPVIIQKDTWDMAKQKMCYREKHTRIKRHSGAYALTGYIYCGVCGSHMTGQSGYSTNGERYYYYRCSTKNNYKEQANRLHISCTSRNINRDKLENLVLQATVNVLCNPEAIKLIAQQAVASQKSNAVALEMARIRKEHKSIEGKLKNVVKAIERGLHSKTLADRIAEYESHLAELDVKEAELKLKMPMIDIDEVAVEFFLHSLLKNKKEHNKYRLDMFQTFIRRVIVHPDTIETQYNYTNHPKILENPVSIPLTGSSEKTQSSRYVPMVTQ